MPKAAERAQKIAESHIPIIQQPTTPSGVAPPESASLIYGSSSRLPSDSVFSSEVMHSTEDAFFLSCCLSSRCCLGAQGLCIAPLQAQDAVRLVPHSRWDMETRPPFKQEGITSTRWGVFLEVICQVCRSDLPRIQILSVCSFCLPRPMRHCCAGP